MTKFNVEFSYNVPEWGDIELVADGKEEAEDEALRHIEMTFPEATDVEITSVKEIED